MFFLSLAMLALAAPHDGRWLKLFNEPDETTYLDGSSLGGGPDPMVWIRHDFPRPRAGGVVSIKDQWHVSCRDRTFTIYAMISYDRKGRIVSARAIPPDQRHAAELSRGSRMEKVFSAACPSGR